MAISHRLVFVKCSMGGPPEADSLAFVGWHFPKSQVFTNPTAEHPHRAVTTQQQEVEKTHKPPAKVKMGKEK